MAQVAVEWQELRTAILKEETLILEVDLTFHEQP